MTRFLRTMDGDLINTDRIERIEEAEPQLRAIFVDGSILPLVGDIDVIERVLLPVIAAAPGYVRLCHYDFDDGQAPFVERIPVVAWRIGDRRAFPVTVDNDNDDLSGVDTSVLLPDGRVVSASGDIFADEAAWMAAMEKEVKRRREAEARRKLKLVASTDDEASP